MTGFFFYVSRIQRMMRKILSLLAKKVKYTILYTVAFVYVYQSIPSPGFAVLTQLPCPLALQRADRRRGRGLLRVRVRVKGRGLGLVRDRVRVKGRGLGLVRVRVSG